MKRPRLHALAGGKATWEAQKLTRIGTRVHRGEKFSSAAIFFRHSFVVIKLSAFWRFTKELPSRTLSRRVLVVKRGCRVPRGFTESVCERYRRRKTENRVPSCEWHDDRVNAMTAALP